MHYNDATAYLLALPRYADRGVTAYKPGLDRIQTLLAALGHPHTAWPSVHVAGTNGKGSTASLLAAVASATGRRVGLHTSPHLYHLTERMRLDGVPAPEAWLADAVSRYQTVFDAVRPSFFEATVALSFLYFAETNVDLAIVEVGLGGRLDATNILQPELALITQIGYDHVEILGDTLAQIAREKAGIIKPDVPILTAVHEAEALRAICDVAWANAAPFHTLQEEVAVLESQSSLAGNTLCVQTPLRRYNALHVGLPGHCQQTNALLALRAAELLFDEVATDATALYEGLSEVRKRTGLRGRLEVWQTHPLVVADVGHNAEALSEALDFIGTMSCSQQSRCYVLFGILRDKDLFRMGQRLADTKATVWPVPLESERALPVADLASRLAAQGVTVEDARRVPEGLIRFREVATPHDVLLITGSHQVLAQVPQPTLQK